MSILQRDYEATLQSCQDTTLLGTFTENQDQPRLAVYTSDISLLKNALAFALLSDGIPIVYYGAEQQYDGRSDPFNREALWGSRYNTSSPLYTHITTINAARNAVAKASTYTYWSPYWTWKSKFVMALAEMVVVRKGYDHSIVTIMTNQGQNSADLGPYTIGDTNFTEGDVVMDVLTCQTQTVGKYGGFPSCYS
jgi:alpha-amylase